MKRTIYYAAVIGMLAISLKLHAQDKEKKNAPDIKGPPAAFVMKDTFNFTMISNNPENQANLNIFINPACFELYGLNINMGYEGGIHYTVNKGNRFSFWGLYRGTYYESVFKNTVGERNSIGGPATSPLALKNAELGLEYNFIYRTEKNDEVVNVGRFGGYMASRNLTANYLLACGIRLGVQYFQTYVSGDQVPLSGYYIDDPSRTKVNFGLGQVGTNMQEYIINVGASMASTHAVVIKNNTLGERENRHRTYLYCDILFAPEMVYTNVIMKNYSNISRLPYTDFNLNTDTYKSRIGARFGFTYYDLSKAGLTFGIEAGARPGPTFITGLYGLLKVGIVINSKVY